MALCCSDLACLGHVRPTYLNKQDISGDALMISGQQPSRPEQRISSVSSQMQHLICNPIALHLPSSPLIARQHQQWLLFCMPLQDRGSLDCFRNWSSYSMQHSCLHQAVLMCRQLCLSRANRGRHAVLWDAGIPDPGAQRHSHLPPGSHLSEGSEGALPLSLAGQPSHLQTIAIC